MLECLIDHYEAIKARHFQDYQSHLDAMTETNSQHKEELERTEQNLKDQKGRREDMHARKLEDLTNPGPRRERPGGNRRHKGPCEQNRRTRSRYQQNTNHTPSTHPDSGSNKSQPRPNHHQTRPPPPNPQPRGKLGGVVGLVGRVIGMVGRRWECLAVAGVPWSP